MTSSRFRPEIYRTLIHPLMSVSVSSTGVIALIWLVGANFGIAAPRVGTVIAVVVASLLEAVAGNILYKERAGIGNRVRELLIYLIVVYAAYSLVRSGPIGVRFVPSPFQVFPVFAATLAWLIAYLFHDRLRGRESLLRAFHGKHGAELRHAVLDRQHDMALTVAQLRKARGLIGSLFVALCLFAILGTLDFLQLSALGDGPGSFVVLVLYGVSAIAVIGSLNTFIEEYAANGEGLTVPMRFHRRRTLIAAALILILLVLAFGLSRNEAILPIEAIGDFFRWLGSLFAREPQGEPPAPEFQPPPPQDTGPSMQEMLTDLEGREPPLWLRVLARLMERLAITVAILLGAVLLFGPLFSPAFRKALRDLKPSSFLRELWSNLRTRLRIIGRFLKHGLRRRGRHRATEDEIQADASSDWRERRWKPGPRKRRQMDRVVQTFVEITRWGERHGVRYTHPEAAHDYLRRVAELRPERYADSVYVADTFCEARFSRHLVPRERIREYVQAAKRITSSE